MKISWNASINNLCKDYFDELEKKLKKPRRFPENIQGLIKSFFNYIDYDNTKNDFTSELIDYANQHDIKEVAKLFDGELRELPLFFLGEEWTELWLLYIKAEADSPYTVGYGRRSMRSKRVDLHSSNIQSALKAFLTLKATGFNSIQILRGGRTPEEIKELYTVFDRTPWLTAMIKNGDRDCISYLEEAMTSENNANRLSYEYFRAIAKSDNVGLLELEGKLLLAARLQEGLRQSIVETMDEGTPNSYIYLLNVIKENNLQRFAAVKRSLAVTTGLSEADAPERIDDKFIRLVYIYVTSREDREKAVASNDAMEIYLALWSMAFYDVESIAIPIKQIIASAPAYRVEASMLLLTAIQYPELYTTLVSDTLHLRSNDHGIMAGALPLYLNSYKFRLSWYGDPDPVPPLSEFFKSRDEAIQDFNILISLLESMKGTENFEPYVFPWIAVKLSRGEVAMRIAKIALLLGDQEYLDRALDYVGFMEPYERAGATKYLLRDPSTSKQIAFAVSGLADRGTEAREVSCKIVEQLHNAGKLTSKDYRNMEDYLRLKAANMRIAIISILSSLTEADALESVQRLLNDKTTDRRLAGLDIIKNWIDKGERTELVKSLITTVEEIKRPTSKEKILIENILEAANTSTSAYNAANGFGLYNPQDGLHLNLKYPENFDIEKALTFSDKERAKDIMLKIMKLIEENADYEFTNSWGETVRLGNTVKREKYGDGLKALAKPEMWKEFYEREINSPSDMLRLDIATGTLEDYNSPFFPLFKRLLGKAFHPDGTMKDIKALPYYHQACDVCRCLIHDFEAAPENWKTCIDILSVVVSTVSPEEMIYSYNASYSRYGREAEHSILGVWPFEKFRRMLEASWQASDDNLFIESFTVRYDYYRKLGYKSDFNPVNPIEYLRIWDMGRITDNEFWHEMMGRESSSHMVDVLTQRLPLAPRRHKWQQNIPVLNLVQCSLVGKAVDRILEIELQRGDTPTVVTKLASKINVVSGIDYFLKIIVGLGKEKPKCSFWGLADNKRDTFSWLLHVSCPADGDTADELRPKAKAAGVSDERLVEAAMYSPRWLELVEEATGWKGLESATYYFLAHTGERLEDNVKSHIARYTSVTPEDFADGAFDPVWFREVYKVLGKKRFEVVYEAAKYISEGNRHTRARKLSDAALGILKAKEVQKEIEAKRNKDLVVAYGLIPLSRNRIKDLRQRYAVLNKFLKESKQFGSQRQTSEGRAVKLALDNLARTAGFGDSTRLTWSMEADLVKEASEYLEPKEIEGVTVYIELGEGTPELVMESKGKRLQSLPTRLKKDKYIEKMRETYRQFKDQHVRGRALLETSMVDSSEFTGEEIAQLHENPIIWTMFSRLVLVKDGDVFGFPGDDGHSLVSASGEIIEIYPGDRLRIAHPYDLMQAGVWSDYQTALFQRQWRQPFKQVFRELYVPTQEEKQTSQSMRYAGNQIMPARTVGMLKKRQWVVDYENGLQKVCFNGDVTAVMYALADWFSPSDIEAPTLEYVAFYDRRTFKDKKIEDVEPIVFSEIMRDVDLAVSVAHAGSVDPEASHSTIEMRKVIVEHAMPMFGISNVKIVGNFAKIKGELGSYNVHLGSGIIHKEGGAQIAVLPVHSQGRGRIFLPFLDEDPKTAEIISKILLFAEDTKIKDPSILDQM